MTKKELRQYSSIKAEIKQIEAEVKEFYETCVRPTMLDGLPRGNKKTDPTAELAEKAAKLHTKLLRKKYNLACLLEKIENGLDSLDSCERRVLREYYINNLEWEAVCAEIGYCRRQILRIHSRALRKMSHNVTY